MKKINCLIGLLLLAISLSAFANANRETVYLIASSTQYDEQVVPKIIKMFNDKGYDVDTKYLDQQVSDLGYVNTDKVRADTLVAALKDDNVKYLWFIKGGAGALNLMPYLYQNRDEIKKTSPKIIIGFSDVTAVHYFINKYLGWPSLHGIVAALNKDINNNHKENKVTMNMNNGVAGVFEAIKKGVAYDGLIPLNEQAKKGVSGMLYGGNLTLVQSLFSTEYEKHLPDEILAIEDTGVSYRQLDRTLHQIEYKKDAPPKAIIFGQFFPLDPTDADKLIFKTVIKEFAERYPAPVFYYPYFGHGATNNPLILSSPVNIQCEQTDEYCQLTQPMMEFK
jgi:muramoyltetrapeptide carboxypeptidase